MSSFNALSIRFKILLIPIVGSVGFAIYLFTSLLAMSQIVKDLDRAYAVEYQYLQTSAFGLVQLDKIKETLGNAATMGEADLLTISDGYAEAFRSKLIESYKIDEENVAFLKQLLRDFNTYYLHASTLSKEMVDGTIDFATLSKRSEQMTSELNEVQRKLNDFQNEKDQGFNNAFESVRDKVQSTSTVGIVIGLITILLLFVVAVPIAISICNSLRNVISSLKNIAQDNGDLTVRLTTNYKDEIGDLVFWFNSFIEKLQGVIKDVVNTAMPLAKTANKIQNLSEHTIDSFKRQSDSVASSRNSVDEMSHRVADITSNAADAVSSARNANDEARNGKLVVDKTVSEIRQLADVVTESSEIINQLQEDTNKVNVVLEVIRGIADQTNLLALNAAIEAARAGEQGRGFAVVADEVRNLASRTQESTQEINNILAQLQSASSKAVSTMESSKAGVESSVESANQAGESLLEIASAIEVISQMNDAIANSTEQQTEVSGIMVNHVEDIQRCADEASNASTEIAETSNELTELASKLESIALQFKV
ncbi:HAMP domain-containing methyl-accepting chemotaxis protein [Colwellia sp. E2M01]|uniref:methyl-accepting chemotaxis protein n=1 Tax=Colwellia sp. E2M01 TaxID=2841561 RepID=UPI001C08E928|nr:HAMP domain-containing methyl-accepting chemotaxis protein [Colwellia sp. E2M01]MBU2872000.1 methyl-accepting chemotaxis protein [Colwellia sp. E2M01]